MDATEAQTFIMAAIELKAGDRIVAADGTTHEVAKATLGNGVVIVTTATGIGVLRNMAPVEVVLP